LQNADLSTLYNGLNAMGRVPWKINDRILEVAQCCWDSNIAVGDVPSKTDLVVPPKPVRPKRAVALMDKGSPEYKRYVAENRKYREALSKYNRIRQKNMVGFIGSRTR
jgi:DNA-directed RNA polymerase, mitochondrial